MQYTSNNHIQWYLKRTGQENNGNSTTSPPIKKSRRPIDIKFDFKCHCILCASECAMAPDAKNPARWQKNKGILCKTADRGEGKLSFKDVTLQVR